MLSAQQIVASLFWCNFQAKQWRVVVPIRIQWPRMPGKRLLWKAAIDTYKRLSTLRWCDSVPLPG